MLAFMAYPTPRDRGTSTTTATYSTGNDSVTTASMDERPPHSFLSLSTEGSSAIWEEDSDPLIQRQRQRQRQEELDESDQDLHRRAKNCCAADQDPTTTTHAGKKPTNTTAMYIERIYEHTVHGPCQTVTMCEVEHLDLFMVSSTVVVSWLQLFLASSFTHLFFMFLF
jgi:hypothetical protein